MSRFFNKKTAFILTSITVLLFVMPETTHAVDWFDLTFGTISKVVIWPLELILLPLAASLMTLAGNLLDQTIQFALHTAYIFSLSPAINMGWVIVRDICNIFFIFVLIYISLGTIIQGTKFGTKALLTQVIIAALLINFSLFITKAVVDVSNVFGNWLYSGVENTLKVNSANQNDPTSLSGLIVTRMGIVNIWSPAATQNNNNQGALLSYGASSSITGIFLRLIIVFMVTYFFIYSAVLFISRSITILFLLVFSPVGFMGGVLPQLKKYSGQWRDELLGTAIFPIAFLLMLYISLQFINTLQALSNSALKDQSLNLFGITISLTQYFQYFLIIFLLLATLRVAKENSGELGKLLGGAADSLGKMAISAGIGLGTGGIGIAGRSLAAGVFAQGKNGAAATLSERWSKSKDTFVSNSPLLTKLRLGPSILSKEGAKKLTEDVFKKGTYDMRNMQIGGLVGPTLEELAKNSTGFDVSKTGNVLGLKTDQQTRKEIKDEKKKWDEEISVDKAEKAILEDMRDLMVLQEKLEEAKRNNPGGVAAAQILLDAKKMDMATPAGPGMLSTNGRIREELNKLSNKQLEKLGIKINANEHVAGLMTGAEVKHLKENSELNDSDKGKIWSARIRPLTDALSIPLGTPNRDSKVGESLKRLSDAEVADLSIDKLLDTDVMDNLTIGQLGKIAGSFTRGDREAIRNHLIATKPPGDKVREWLENKTQGQAF